MRHGNASLALVLLILLPTIAVAAPVQAQTEFTIWTDKSEYSIGEPVTIHIQPPMRIGAQLWIVIWTPDGSQVRGDLSPGQDSITFSDITVTPGQYKAELWGQAVAPEATPEFLANYYFQVERGPPPSADVKFQGVVSNVWDQGVDYQVTITTILSDPGGCLRVGASAMVSAWQSSLVIGSPGVGDTVEVYGVVYNCDPNNPGLYVKESYHYIRSLSPPHVCDEGAVQNVVMCSDGVNWRQREVCRNNKWVPESQTCPPVCSEGAVNVLEMCPDGYTWRHRQVCRNNAWSDEYQQCPARPPELRVDVWTDRGGRGPNVAGGTYQVGETVTLYFSVSSAVSGSKLIFERGALHYEESRGALGEGTYSNTFPLEHHDLGKWNLTFSAFMECSAPPCPEASDSTWVTVERRPTQAPTAYVDSISPNPAEQGEKVSFSGHGSDPDGFIVEYKWTSNIDGQLSNLQSFSTSSLSVGVHSIHFKVKDNDGLWSEEATATLEIGPTPLCSEGAVNVLETCPDGSTWRHRQVCKNKAWVDEYQQCPTSRACSVEWVAKSLGETPTVSIKYHPGDSDIDTLYESVESAIAGLSKYFEFPTFSITIYTSDCEGAPQGDLSLPAELQGGDCDLGCWKPGTKLMYMPNTAPLRKVAHEMMHAIEYNYYGPVSEFWLYYLDKKNGELVTEGIAEYGSYLITPDIEARPYREYLELVKCIAESAARERNATPESVIISILKSLGGFGTPFVPWYGVDGVVNAVTGRHLAEWKTVCNYQLQMCGYVGLAVSKNRFNAVRNASRRNFRSSLWTMNLSLSTSNTIRETCPVWLEDSARSNIAGSLDP